MTGRIAGLAGVAFLAALLIPFSYQVCPRWDVSVVDASGQPLPGMTVRLNYQDYSVENVHHEVDQISDSQGKASFPGQWASRPLAWRGAGAVLSAFSHGVHASIGRHSDVFAFGGGLRGYAVSNGFVTDWTGKPSRMSSKITALDSRSQIAPLLQ